MTRVPRSPRVRIFLVTLLVSIAAVMTAHGQVPTAADVTACNDEAPAAVKAGGASPTVGDHARARGARDGSTTGVGAFKVPLIESSDPQIHGMNAEGAKDAVYQAAYRSCMRRKGF